MNTIISKRTSPFTYQKWAFTNGRIYQDGPGIVINGGAGIVGGAELLSGRPLDKRTTLIPVGVMTFVDDEVLDKLMTIPKFTSDMKRGLITVVKGRKISDQEKINDIAEKELVDSANIPNRPISEQDISDAGGKINHDGSVDIRDAEEDIELVRRQNAGQPFYIKQREKQKRAEKKAAKSSRKVK